MAFEGIAGSPPLSVRQQALRGIAKIAIERGDRTAAKAQYERILGKVLLGRGPPAEHWAHAEYAWLQFEDGDLQVRRRCCVDGLGVGCRSEVGVCGPLYTCLYACVSPVKVLVCIEPFHCAVVACSLMISS